MNRFNQISSYLLKFERKLSYTPGHGCSLHNPDSLCNIPYRPTVPGNKQSNPSCADGGLLHKRVLLCLPPPQLEEQVSYEVQSPQLPLTEINDLLKLVQK